MSNCFGDQDEFTDDLINPDIVDSSNLVDKSIDVAKSIPSILWEDKKLLAAIIGQEVGEFLGKWVAKKIIGKSVEGSVRFVAGTALKGVISGVTVIMNVALVMDIANLITGMKRTKYPDYDLIDSVFDEFDKQFAKEPELSEYSKKCLKQIIKDTALKLNVTLTEEQLEIALQDAIKTIKDQPKYRYKIAKNIPSEIDPQGSDLVNECRPISYKDFNKMLLPTDKCTYFGNKVYEDYFKQYMTQNYPNIRLEKINTKNCTLKQPSELTNICKIPIIKKADIIDKTSGNLTKTIDIKTDKIVFDIDDPEYIGDGKSCKLVAYEYIKNNDSLKNYKRLLLEKKNNKIEYTILCENLTDIDFTKNKMIIKNTENYKNTKNVDNIKSNKNNKYFIIISIILLILVFYFKIKN
jgi:hypothetical protein